MFFPDGTLPAVVRALLLGLTCLAAARDLAEGSADFSGEEVQHFAVRLDFVEPGGDLAVASTAPLGSTRACGVPRHARTHASPTVYFINRVGRGAEHADQSRGGASTPCQLCPPSTPPPPAPVSYMISSTSH